MAFAWISSNTSTSFSSSSLFNSNNYIFKFSKFQFHPNHGGPVNCSCSSKFELSDLKFVLHDTLDLSGHNTSHVRAARLGFCSQIENFSELERETSISFNKGVDLGKAALHIAAEDDSLISHSSVPLPVDDFIERLYSLCMGFCSHYSSSYGASPEKFLQSLERFLYVHKGFRRTNAKHQVEQRALYLNSVLTHRSGSLSMLSLIYSEMLKMLRMWGVLDFDVEIFFPHDPYSSPRGYLKQKSKESDPSHIMTSQSLLVEILKDLKNAFWPFQLDRAKSPFLRAAQAANCSNGINNTKQSAMDLASAKAGRHRLQRGVWTSVRFGDIRRALSACERLILLKTDPKELRDYAVLLYHCGFYEESLQYFMLYQEMEVGTSSQDLEEEDAVEKLVIRLNLILMEEGWTRQSDNRSMLFNNSEPW